MIKFKIALFAILVPLAGYSQIGIIRKVEFRVDTLSIVWPNTVSALAYAEKLAFPFNDDNEVAEIEVWPAAKVQITGIAHSSDFILLDSIIYTGYSYRFKLKFNDLTHSEFLRLGLKTVKDSLNNFIEINLQPYTSTFVKIYPKDDELFIGEEKVFELLTNNRDNIYYSNDWTTGKNIDYRITELNGNLLLHLVPNTLGLVTLEVPLTSRKPRMNEKQQLSRNLPILSYTFNVKASRIQFLNIDEKELTLDDKTRLEGVEIQLENNRMLQMNKTYRIEDQEEPGGPLIAEIFTKRLLANNKVLCIIRPYNFHKQTEGYLYIKEGDVARFITNFSITHATTIEKISILREGNDWKESNVVYPGETVEIKLEGKGMHKGKFYFEGLKEVTQDSLLRTEFQALYSLQIPIDISHKIINIYDRNNYTGKSLKVSEFQLPREFDYVYLNFGDMGRRYSGTRSPVLYESTVQDVSISFNTDQIDDEMLYGKQYMDLDVRITGKKNELIEMRTIKNIAVCPSEKSPRYDFYSSGDCISSEISLNKYLSRKTYDLDEWSKISLSLYNEKDKYGGEGNQKDIDIILKRTYSFDVEVSFPAGLITASKQSSGADSGKVGFGSLSGISMAMIGQFSFYQPDKIARYRPYKIGAGFLAFNAFNFSDNNDNRDLGIVILGSIYPTTKDVKLSFPLYVGGGYFLKDQKWFFLIGPGIRITL